MLTSSTRPLSRLRAWLAPLAAALVLAGCASHPSAPEQSGDHVVSKYAAQRQGTAAGASNAAHIPPVLHSPEAEKQAQAATPDYVMALKAMNDKDYHKAMVIFQSIASRYPLLSGPLVNEGLIYLEQAKYDDAQTVLNDAIKVNNKNPYAWNALGMTERQLGHFDAAKKAYQQALTLDPLYARAHFNLAVLADLYLDDLPLALEHYQRYQALQATPDKNVTIWIADLTRRSQQQAAAPAAQGKADTNNHTNENADTQAANTDKTP